MEFEVDIHLCGALNLQTVQQWRLAICKVKPLFLIFKMTLFLAAKQSSDKALDKGGFVEHLLAVQHINNVKTFLSNFV